MPQGDGWDSQVGLGHETTWGTPVAPTQFIEHAGVSGGLLSPLLRGETFRGRSERVLYRGANKDELQIISELQYEGWEDLFYHLLGNVGTANVNGAFEHTFTVNDANPLPGGAEKSLTVEVKHGDAMSIRHEGMKVNQLTLDAQIDKILKATFGLVGENEEEAGPAAATFPTAPLINWQEITIERGLVNKEAESAQIIIANNFFTDRRVLGSATVKEHRPQRLSVSGTVTAWFEDNDWWTVFKNDTVASMDLRGISTVQIPGSSPAEFYTFDMFLPNVHFEAHEKPIPDASPLRQTIPFVAKAAGGSTIATLVIKNGRTTVP